MTRLYNDTQQREIAPAVKKADNFFSRLSGLMGVDSKQASFGLWIIPCSSIHTFGMKAPIDVCFLDKKLRVVSVKRGIKPRTLGPGCRGAHSVVEFFCDSWDAGQIEEGDLLRICSEP